MKPTLSQQDLEKLAGIFLVNAYTLEGVIHNIKIARTFWEQVYFIQSEDTLSRMNEVVAQYSQDPTASSLVTSLVMHQASFRKETFYTTLNQLRTYFEGLPLLTIYIPRELNTTFLGIIGQKARTIIPEPHLIRIKINPFLGGGAVFVWNDISFDASLQEKLRLNHGKIRTLITSYEKTKGIPA